MIKIEEEDFVIIQFSDIHVFNSTLPDYTPFYHFLNKRLLSFFDTIRLSPWGCDIKLFNSMSFDIHQVLRIPFDRIHYLCTGDVTHLGTKIEFEQARDIILNALNDTSQISIVPGNHDIIVRRSLRERYFQNILKDFMISEYPTLEEGFPFVKIIEEKFIIVGLNSAVPHFCYGDSRGYISPIQLEIVENSLHKIDLYDKVVIAFMHHSPCDWVNWRSILRDRRHVLDRLIEIGVDYLFTGHTHQTHLDTYVHSKMMNKKLEIISSGALLPTNNDNKWPRYGIYVFNKGESGEKPVLKRKIIRKLNKANSKGFSTFIDIQKDFNEI
eukprot:TRINITY_DN4548_c0_g1_i1.p1 TRINITY_DN4548_c0_g1~~TRINITY_DN4548_c0_g1_i1.p1  ORF type:complete len:326 (-),score=56.73 TRINITY_DN4548_c0_g1_i1:40-1017(-)